MTNKFFEFLDLQDIDSRNKINLSKVDEQTKTEDFGLRPGGRQVDRVYWENDVENRHTIIK